MSRVAPLPPFAAIVVAAGQGLRAGQPLPKQFATWRGKPVVRHSVETLLSAGASPVVVAIPEGGDDIASASLAGLSVQFVTGGETRQASVLNALETLSGAKRVLIHDAARPVLHLEVVERLLSSLDAYPGAIPVLPVVDSLAVDEGGVMAGTADRETLCRVQTPQAFRYAEILAAHRAWTGPKDAGDDAQVLRAAGGTIGLVEGSEALKKLTFAEDFVTELPLVRMGSGFDVHRLVADKKL